MSRWREVTIAELCRRTTSGGTPSRKRSDFFCAPPSGVPWVKSQELVDRRISSVSEHITDAGLRASSAKLLPANTILVAMYGATVGQLGYLDIEAAVNQAICALITDPGVTDPRFLYYAIMNARVELVAHAHGAAQQNLSQERIRNFKLWIPEIDDQRQIAGVLTSIDDLIENNRRRISLLEQMAQAIYREWFVVFRYPGHEGAAVLDSSIGPIPKGWGTARLETVAAVNRFSRRPQAGEKVRYLDISCLGDRSIGALAEIDGASAPGRARRVVTAGDVAWSMVRPNRRAHALLLDPGSDWIASTGLAILTPTGLSSSLLFEMVSARQFSDYLISKETGAAYPAVKPADFAAALFLIPPPEIDRLFEQAVGPHHRMIWNLRQQSDALEAIRDELLPRLVTGQIDVSKLDLDNVMEPAA